MVIRPISIDDIDDVSEICSVDSDELLKDLAAKRKKCFVSFLTDGLELEFDGCILFDSNELFKIASYTGTYDIYENLLDKLPSTVTTAFIEVSNKIVIEMLKNKNFVGVDVTNNEVIMERKC